MLAKFNATVSATYQHTVERFLSLPFADLPQAGALLTAFSTFCRERLQQNCSPVVIVTEFFETVAGLADPASQTTLLFWFLQFIERQVVLFDAIEDAAFEKMHESEFAGTIEHWLAQATHVSREDLENYRIRLVLTAHPTQFYPSQIIGILQDLTAAMAADDQVVIGELLLQMAQTSFVNAHKPTPYDEALFLCDYLDQVFYPVISQQQNTLNKKFGLLPVAIEVGFWPGGDRDGNPNVTTPITVAVVELLHGRIINNYLRELAALKHRLTFKQVWESLLLIEARLQATQQAGSSVPSAVAPYRSAVEFQADLVGLKSVVDEEHAGLYADKLAHLIAAVTCFGFHYAALDIRQDAQRHSRLVHDILRHLDSPCDYAAKTAEEKLTILSDYLSRPAQAVLPTFAEGSVEDDTLKLFEQLTAMQQRVGERGICRYIISHTQAAFHVLEVMVLCHWSGLSDKPLPLDIIPLFESIDDLASAAETLLALYTHTDYRRHLASRNNTQTIMLGYSDGTKDGGYLTANWAIYRAKAELARVSELQGITCLFFDGRGGPPSRGGGNTHKFYRALASNIPQQELQLTLQGQTISTNFGTVASARFNVGQLYTAGLAQIDRPLAAMTAADQHLLGELAEFSAVAYQALIHHPKFLTYLEEMTPMKYFGDLNIASRPPRRDQQGALNLDNLRAITFVSSWSQMKQNVPGYYGFGAAVQKLIELGKLVDLQQLYKHNLYFHTLVENTMQSLLKNYFPLTQYLASDPEYGEFWQLLAAEARLTESVLLKITGQAHLLAEEPVIRASIQLREAIVCPLQVIQQYALMKLRQPETTAAEADVLKKLILKSLPTNLNAGRNSA